MIYFFTIFLNLIGGYAYAGSAIGTVSYIITADKFVYFNINPANYATCASNTRYVLDASMPFGKNSYAMLLVAHAQGIPVGVVSQGLCDLLPNDAETVVNVYLP